MQKSDFEKIIDITHSQAVQYGFSLPKDLHKRLVLGQTRYVCRYGTLSEGHEKITPAQRYYQAIKELYYIACNIKEQQVIAMEAQAEILDAEDHLTALTVTSKESDRLRAQAKLMRARNRLSSALVTVQDQMRMVDEYDRIRKELEPMVEAAYPEGIEQAEEDNWKAVLEYRMAKEKVPGMARERLDNIPLSPIEKAKLGFSHGRLDAMAPLGIGAPAEFHKLEQTLNLLPNPQEKK